MTPPKKTINAAADKTVPVSAAPSADTRHPSDRQWRVEVDEHRVTPGAVADPPRRIRDLHAAVNDLATMVGDHLAGRATVDDLTAANNAALAIANDPSLEVDAFQWRLYCSDVDGKPWDLVGQGTATRRDDAIAAATHLRDINVAGDVIGTEVIDL